MAMVINTNMGSLNANRILERTGLEQSKAMERLTSGKQINTAADNAAGLSIVTGMTSQIRGTDQAMRNANDGVSLVQTLDGAMGEVVNMLQRMRELSVQSLNGTYNDTNRAQMNTEYSQLATEIQRVGQTTAYNDKNLLNGSITNVSLHVGWNVGAQNQVKISTFNVSKVGTDLLALKISTQTGASTVIASIDGRLGSINTARAKFGAVQNRLESTIANLSNVNENLNGGRSRIEDTNFAKESANLARTQVLQQAGMSMLSQANASSQNVLSLLR